ncbi:hypothetical protein [Actinocrispum wychmicini]|uniref:Shikimate kinase n=1 Tax=Actinocrispum wychmicini TaxID=1213861 RepID=A0A4R2JGB2_9PSEU|nr:hypothetical protein [Actinocrispum wychmicini]TCO57322.1 hypothetical protein EV192_106799 [Actinocrispum wychmicini]
MAEDAAADPFGTLRKALWIGGGQWAGKSTVARILAMRHGLTAYHYDYHDARGHNDRRIARRVHTGQSAPDPEDVWVNTTPADMAVATLGGFPERFEWALDDLRALVSPHPIIAEGWGLRPELVAPLVAEPRQMVVMVPTEEFRQRQLRALPRAARTTHQVSDPERAQRNRIARDRLVATDAARAAHQYGMRVIEVDGSVDAEGVADILSAHFQPYLP